MAARSYHHGNLHDALIEAATTLVREGGPDAVSMRTIAEKVGVSRAAPYHHFKDKEAILAAVAQVGFQMLIAEMQDTDHTPGDPWNQLRVLGGAYVRFALNERQLVNLMFGGGLEKAQHPPLAEAGMRCYAMLLELITRGLEVNGVTNRQPDVVAMSAWSTVHGLAMLQSDGTAVVARKFKLGLEHPDCHTLEGPDPEMIELVLDTLTDTLRGLRS